MTRDSARQPAARAAIVEDISWERAVERALQQTRGIFPDLAVVFASDAYRAHFPEIVQRIRTETGASILVGCSGQGIIGPAEEMEQVPALALLTVALPNARLRATYLTPRAVEACESPAACRGALEVAESDVNAWLVFVDPFRTNCEGLIDRMAAAYPGRPMLGGLASADQAERETSVFLDGDVYTEGGVCLAIGGPYSVLPLVSQGCEPIGKAWTITGARGNVVETISNRPAYEVLVETFRALPAEAQRRASRNLLVGLAADEYRDEYRRGDFLIRNLAGVDPRSGALAIGAHPRVGQTIQFQIRDAAAADDDLSQLLDQATATLGESKPIAAVLCSCNGRGVGLFGTPDHDAGAIAAKLGNLPLAGLFCNGEIGPIGARPFLHGFTASLALIVRSP